MSGPAPFPPGAGDPQSLTGSDSATGGAGDAPTSSGRLAALALGSGVLSFLCAPVIGALLAIGLGWAARSRLRAAGAPRSEQAQALAAITLGLCNLLFVSAALAVFVGVARSVAPGQTPVARQAPEVPVHPPSRPGAGPGHYSEDQQVQTLEMGSLTLVDVGPGVDSLDDELERQALLAQQEGKLMVLWISAPACAPCNGVAAALSDPRMQQALGDTRLVRVNRDEFAAELDFLGVPVDRIPGFVLVDDKSRPLDYVDGGEWDEDIAPNIAPVLSKFVRGNYNARRRIWRGGPHRDVTAL